MEVNDYNSSSDISEPLNISNIRKFSFSHGIIPPFYKSLNVFDRLTCETILEEANKVGLDSDSEIDFYNKIPKSLSSSIHDFSHFTSLLNLKESTYCQPRIRGATPSFEKLPIFNLDPIPEYKIKDQSSFIERENNHLSRKNSLSNGIINPQLWRISEKSKKIAHKAFSKTPEKNQSEIIINKIEEKPKSSNSISRLVFNVEKDCIEKKNLLEKYEKEKTQKELQELNNIYHVSDYNKKLAKKSELRRKKNEEKIKNNNLDNKNQKIHYRHSIPIYIKKINDFLNDNNLRTRERSIVK